MVEFFFVLIPRHLPFLLQGAVVTLQLSVVSMAAALLIGVICARARTSSNLALRTLAATYIEVMRNVPLLVVLLIVFFTLPQIGISLPAFWAGVLGLSLNVGAYLAEVFRAAFGAVDRGEQEAALSIGMSRTTVFLRVTLPQAMRVAIPTIGGFFIALLKDSSLVSFISVSELMRQGTILISNTFRSMEIYLMVGLVYFAMSFVAARIVRRLELRLTPRYLRTTRLRPRAAARAGAGSSP
jgi:polar amino acid transport system permease protein